MQSCGSTESICKCCRLLSARKKIRPARGWMAGGISGLESESEAIERILGYIVQISRLRNKEDSGDDYHPLIYQWVWKLKFSLRLIIQSAYMILPP